MEGITATEKSKAHWLGKSNWSESRGDIFAANG